MSAKTLAQNEPVGVGAAIVGLIAAAGPLLVLIGIDLSPEVLAGINALAVAAVGLVAALVRSKVIPVNKDIPESTEGASGPVESASPEGREPDGLGGYI